MRIYLRQYAIFSEVTNRNVIVCVQKKKKLKRNQLLGFTAGFIVLQSISAYIIYRLIEK